MHSVRQLPQATCGECAYGSACAAAAGEVWAASGAAATRVCANTAAGSTPVTTRIYAEGICCPSEVPLIRRILEPMAGVTQARPLALYNAISRTGRAMLAGCASALGAGIVKSSQAPDGIHSTWPSSSWGVVKQTWQCVPRSGWTSIRLLRHFWLPGTEPKCSHRPTPAAGGGVGGHKDGDRAAHASAEQ